jgi:predicted nucleic acid-binding protein
MAITEAEDHGRSAMDALHVAAALLSDADQLVTTEKSGKPMYVVDNLEIVYIGDVGEPLSTNRAT